MKHIIVLLLTAVLSIGVSAQEIYLKPVDEAAKDPSLVEFRDKLIAAAERKDTKYVISVMDRDIELSFGGHAGITDFKEMWKPDAKNSVFWKEFLTILKLGGSFGEDIGDGVSRFFAPYTYSNFPDYPELDIFGDGAVIGTDVNLRAEPSMNGKVVGSLSYNIVKIDHKGSVLGSDPPGIKDPPIGAYKWYKVETLGGKKGYVSSDYVRGYIAHRIGLEKRNGKWKITFFIAGD
jgi:hypothetical protein